VLVNKRESKVRERREKRARLTLKRKKERRRVHPTGGGRGGRGFQKMTPNGKETGWVAREQGKGEKTGERAAPSCFVDQKAARKRNGEIKKVMGGLP